MIPFKRFLLSFLSCFLLLLAALNTTGCSAQQQAEAVTAADKLQGNIVAYGQTLGNMLQIGLTDVVKFSPVLAKLTMAAGDLAAQWGMVPVDSQQAATFKSVLATINKIGSTATTASTFLTGLQTTGTVAVAPPTTTSVPFVVPASTYFTLSPYRLEVV